MRRVLKARDRARDRADARSAVAFPPATTSSPSYLAVIRYRSRLIHESIDFRVRGRDLGRRVPGRGGSRDVAGFLLSAASIPSLLLLT